MICLIQYLYWEATGQEMRCDGQNCRWYGGATCYATQEDE